MISMKRDETLRKSSCKRPRKVLENSWKVPGILLKLHCKTKVASICFLVVTPLTGIVIDPSYH